MEAVILAGGKGTRLAEALPPSVPKALAPVGGRPFLAVLLDNLCRHGFERVVLSVGWHADAIIDEFGGRFQGMSIDYCRETSPLGTGGAVKAALKLVRDPDVFVMNGDTCLQVDYADFRARFRESGAAFGMACVWVQDTARYGRVVVRDNRVVECLEKGAVGPGLINAGTYLMPRDLLDQVPSEVFSFELDFLSTAVGQMRPLAYECRGLFIDIGIPEDLERARVEFGTG